MFSSPFGCGFKQVAWNVNSMVKNDNNDRYAGGPKHTDQTDNQCIIPCIRPLHHKMTVQLTQQGLTAK